MYAYNGIDPFYETQNLYTWTQSYQCYHKQLILSIPSAAYFKSWATSSASFKNLSWACKKVSSYDSSGRLISLSMNLFNTFVWDTYDIMGL